MSEGAATWRRGRPVFVLALAAAAIACGDPEPPTPVPRSFTTGPETRLIGAFGVSPDDDSRTRVELTEELVIGGTGEDPNTSFHGVRPIVDVDSEGNVYVVDVGNQRVQVYAPDGEHVRTIGRPGEGPGELRPGSRGAISGDLLGIKALVNPWLQIFALDGEYRGGVEAPGSAHQMVGLESGFALLHVRYRETEPLNTVTLVDPEGDQSRLVEVPGQAMRTAETAIGPLPIPGLTQASSIAAAPGDVVYVASGVDYEVAAVRTDGTVAWVLRVPWVPLPFTEQDREYVRDSLERAGMQLRPDGITWPDTLPALARIRSDGAGRLWVFPATFVTREPVDDDPVSIPADVYGSDGEPLANVTVTTSRWAWQTARDEHVYGVRTSPTTGEWQVVRYRLDGAGVLQ